MLKFVRPGASDEMVDEYSMTGGSKTIKSKKSMESKKQDSMMSHITGLNYKKDSSGEKNSKKPSSGEKNSGNGMGQGQQEDELEFDQEIEIKNNRKLVKTQSLIRIFNFCEIFFRG
jgi:hypothetical protein